MCRLLKSEVSTAGDMTFLAGCSQEIDITAANNNISNQGAVDLAATLASNKKMLELYLGGNDFGAKGAEEAQLGPLKHAILA